MPSLAIRVPAQVSFDVNAPPGLRIDLDAQDSSGRVAAVSFDVSIPMDTGGYRWHITKAEATTNGGDGILILDPASLNLGNGRQLAGYCIASVTTPSGKATRPGNGVIGTEEPCGFLLGFAVGDPETGVVDPGTYHVELNGIVVAVPGPWRLGWDLPSR